MLKFVICQKFVTCHENTVLALCYPSVVCEDIPRLLRWVDCTVQMRPQLAVLITTPSLCLVVNTPQGPLRRGGKKGYVLISLSGSDEVFDFLLHFFDFKPFPCSHVCLSHVIRNAVVCPGESGNKSSPAGSVG